MTPNKYNTIILDCDGVILNSNPVKSEAFFKLAQKYGNSKIAEEFLDYHKQNGGVSRYEKFRYLYKSIMKTDICDGELRGICVEYSTLVYDNLIACELADEINRLRKRNRHLPLAVVSGSDQKELRRLFTDRELNEVFTKGVFGSPDTKEDVMNSQFASGQFTYPAIFFGDSQLDYFVAKKFKCDFVFVYGWTEMKNWKQFTEKHLITSARSLDGFLL